MSVMRNVLLAGSTNPWLRERATKAAFVRRSVRRFWPGERVEDALAAARDLQPLGITTILTALGENLTGAEEAEEVTQHYLEVFDKVAAAGLDAHVSVKPTQLGLDLDRRMCERNLDRLLEPSADGYFLEVKSRTWSQRDARDKAAIITELLALFGASPDDTIDDGYVDLAARG